MWKVWSDVQEWRKVKKWHVEKRIERTVAALRQHGFDAMYIPTKEGVLDKAMELIPPDALVGVGGSVTIRELGLADSLRRRGNELVDHWEAWHRKRTPEEIMTIRRRLAQSDVLLTSTNALTETGHLVNVDHAGQRVAAMIFGPQKVIIIAGTNKIVRDVEEAVQRIKHVAAPMNAKRLNLNVPCAVTGTCTDCDAHDRICNVTTIIERKPVHTNVIVILLGADVGY
jgi:hypothetical protein